MDVKNDGYFFINNPSRKKDLCFSMAVKEYAYERGATSFFVIPPTIIYKLYFIDNHKI